MGESLLWSRPPEQAVITKLYVKNFKRLRDVSVELKPLTVVIGDHGSGKTSLLEAIQTLGGVVASPPRLPAMPVASLAYRGADAPTLEWKVEVEETARNLLPGTARYDLWVSPSATTPCGIFVEGESLQMKGARIRHGGPPPHHSTFLSEDGPAVERGGKDAGVTALSFTGTLDGYPKIKAFGRALSTTAIFAFSPERLTSPSLYPTDLQDPDGEPAMSSDGSGLPWVLDSVLGSDPSRFEAIEDDLRAVAPQIKGIQLVPFVGDDEQLGKRIAFELADGTVVPASSASQGVILFLGYLALVHAKSAHAIILLEAPESGIHPRHLKRLAGYLQHLTDRTRSGSAVQVVATTYSPTFLECIAPESILVVGQKQSGASAVASLLDLPGVEARLHSGFGLSDLWVNFGEERLLGELLLE